MTRSSRFSLAMAAAVIVGLAATSSAHAQPPPEILELANHYVISVQYREAPETLDASALHMAYVTVMPVASQPRALWGDRLQAIRLSPLRPSSSEDGVVWMQETERGHYSGYGFVPAPNAMRSASFADYRDVALPGYDLAPEEAYGGKKKDGGKKKNPDTGGDTGGDTSDPGKTNPGGDDDLVNPWDPDPEPSTPTKPKPQWPDDMGDDLVNPWPGRTSLLSGTFYLAF